MWLSNKNWQTACNFGLGLLLGVPGTSFGKKWQMCLLIQSLLWFTLGFIPGTSSESRIRDWVLPASIGGLPLGIAMLTCRDVILLALCMINQCKRGDPGASATQIGFESKVGEERKAFILHIALQEMHKIWAEEKNLWRICTFASANWCLYREASLRLKSASCPENCLIYSLQTADKPSTVNSRAQDSH